MISETLEEGPMVVLGFRFAMIADGNEALRFADQRPDGAEVFPDDLHLVQLNTQGADLLLQVVAAQPPLLRIRVQSAAAVHLLR